MALVVSDGSAVGVDWVRAAVLWSQYLMVDSAHAVVAISGSLRRRAVGSVLVVVRYYVCVCLCVLPLYCLRLTLLAARAMSAATLVGCCCSAAS